MLSLPTAMLTLIQLVLSAVYCVTEYIMLDFPTANDYFRPGYDADAPGAKLTDLSYHFLIAYLIGVHVLGVLHNRKRRKNLRNHAKQLVAMEDRMDRISLEVGGGESCHPCPQPRHPHAPPPCVPEWEPPPS